MTTIVTRSGKGSPLTNTELDANFNNLNAEVTPARATTRPSLLLDFAQTKQLDPRITFSRASTASYYDGKSVVKAEENLAAYSQELSNAFWSVGANVTLNAAVAPDGTSTANKVAETNSTGAAFLVYRSFTGDSKTYTVSAYMKAAESNYGGLRIDTGINEVVMFDLAAGVICGGYNSAYAPTITAVGNGWYRCTATRTVTTGTWYYCFCVGQNATTSVYNGNGTRGIYIWGAQLEQRSYATAYTPTTGSAITNYIPALQTAASGSARFDHDPVTGESKGLLIEESRTNLLQCSTDLGSIYWPKVRSTYFSNICIAPDGTLTAGKLVPDTSANTHIIQLQGNFASIVASTTYTFSVYVKPAERSFFSISFGADFGVFAADTPGVAFNLSGNGSIASISASGISATITPVNNGWYRITGTTTAVGSGYGIIRGKVLLDATTESFAGNSFAGLYIWGAQLEAGAFATSYIPTPLTYTGRASTATYKSADGTIRIAGNDVARYEPNAAGGSNLLLEAAASNLLVYTNAYTVSTDWTRETYVGSFADNYGISPDGLKNSFYANATNGFIYQTKTLTPGTTYTFSCYVKGSPQSGRGILLYSYYSGTAVAASTQDINASSWTRVSVTYTVPAGHGSFAIMLVGPPLGAFNSGEFWGPQLEVGSVATSYIPSTETHTGRSSTATYYDSTGTIRTAASGQPRYTYNPSLLTAAPKLLLEAQATNKAWNSESLDAGTWTTYNTTVSANSTTAPDGNSTADKIAESTTNGPHMIYAQGTVSANGAVATISGYVKAAERSQVQIYIDSSQASANVSSGVLDLSTGSFVGGGASGAGTFISQSATLCANGWWRISLTFSITGATAYYFHFQMGVAGSFSYAGTTGSGLYIWGVQLEEGYAATSYIPTGGANVTRAADTSTSAAGSRAADVYSSSQVTRAADTASMTGSNFSSWYNASEGTLFTQGSSSSQLAGAYRGYASILSDTSNGFGIYQAITAGTTAEIIVGGSQLGSFAAFPYTNNTLVSAALAYKTNDAGFAVNGVAATSDTTVPSLPQANQMYIGAHRLANNSLACGTIKRIAYYPRRLTNAELQGITS